MNKFPMPKAKYWKKVLDYETILDGYKILAETYDIDYSDNQVFTYIPRLETDKYDEWVGVEPKRFNKNKKLGLNWDKILVSLYLSNKVFGNSYLQTNFVDTDDRYKINWDGFIKTKKELMISPFFNYKEISFNEKEIDELHSFLIDNIDYLKYLSVNTQEGTQVSITSLSKLIEDCDIEANSDLLPPKMLWEHKFNFIPKNPNIRDIINPFFFDSKKWKNVISMIQAKGLEVDSLEPNICHMYNVFQGNLSQIFNQVKDLNNVIYYDFSSIDFHINETDFMKLYNSNKNTSQIVALLTIINKEQIKMEMDSYDKAKSKVMANFYLNKDLDQDFINAISPYVNLSNQIEDVYYNISVLKRYQDYFNKHKNDSCILPNISGEVNKANGKSVYTWEVSTKDNPLNVILGDATDCCQTLDGAGRECLNYGLSKKNSTFFIVKRNDKVIAQSWIWMNKKEKTICFDSIEILGNDTYSEHVIGLYLEASSQLKELFPKYTIIAGADGNRLPSNISELGDYINADEDDLYDLPDDYDGYSDAKHEQYVIC